MSETDSIKSLVMAAFGQVQLSALPDGRMFAALPCGNGAYKLEQISLPNAAEVIQPKTVVQHVKVQTTTSLADYINRFKNEDTVLFADIASNKIEAIVDYHRKPDGSPLTPAPRTENQAATPHVPGDQPVATLGSHRATLALPFSLEWQTWTKSSGQLMSHLAFATFLEENSIDIKNPVGADLLELCRDLQVLNNVTFGGTVRDGDYTTVNYAKESDAASKGGVKLPQSMMLSIPVYFGEAAVPVMAFLRRKVTDGELHLGYVLSRAENVRQEEFHRIVDAVTTAVDHLTTVYGSPA